jgi:Fe-S-cluster containining protein
MLREIPVSAPETTKPWFYDGLRFNCQRCGSCCSGAPGYVWVSDTELPLLAKHLGLSPTEFARRHLRQVAGRLSLLERPGGDCEFLQRLPDGTTGCRVHPVRPVQCRTWPFWKSNLASPDAWARTAEQCPGIGTGENHPRSLIEELVKANGRLPL